MTRVRQLPLWFRYLTAFGVAAIIFVALIIYVDDHSTQAEGVPASPSRSELTQEQQQDETLVKQEQAPHVAKLATGTKGAAAAAAAVNAFMSYEVSRAFYAGPIDAKAACTAAGGTSARQAFTCNLYAGGGAGKLRYPFDVVVAPARAKVTFCQVITPPSYSVKEPPISSACRS
jgi:hypothetical protein